MAFTVDYDTPRGQVRLLIPDDDSDNQILQDAQIDAFLRLEGDNVKRSAAAALERIASSEVLLLKVMRTNDLSTDGAAVARQLLARADKLRGQADSDEADSGDLWDIAEQAETVFQQRERLYKQGLRGI